MNNDAWAEYTPISSPRVQSRSSIDIQEDSDSDPWAEYTPVEQKEDSFDKKVERKVLNAAKGFYQATPMGIAHSLASMFPQMVGTFARNELAEMDDIEDKEAFLQAVENVERPLEKYWPSIENISDVAEDLTGYGFGSRDRGDRLAQLGGMASNIAANPQSALRALLGAPSISATAEYAGVPEPIADLLGLFGVQGLEKGVQKASQKYSQFRNRKTPQDLLRESLGGAPPEPPGGGGTPFTRSDDTLQHLQKKALTEQERLYQESLKKLPNKGITPESKPIEAPADLKGRVTKSNEDLGLRPAPYQTNTTRQGLNDIVTEKLFPNQFYNSTTGGRAIKNQLMASDQKAYQRVNDLYRESRRLNETVNTIHPDLANYLQNTIREISSIPRPSSVQRTKLSTAEDILNEIAIIEDGKITGYRPISNQRLIDQVQSLRQTIDFDFAHGNPKNIFKPMIEELQNSVIRAAEQTNPEAAKAFSEARSAYREWTNTFNNDYINPFRDTSNRDFSKLFKKSVDLDNFNVINDILKNTEEGNLLSKGLQREIVEKMIGKELRNPFKVDTREFQQTLRELEAVLPEETVNEINKTFTDYQVNRPRTASKIETPKKPSILEKNVSKYLEIDNPEKLQKMMNSRSGIRELKKDLSATAQERQMFEKMAKDKIKSILQENQIEKKFSGQDLYNVMNKESNFELMAELTSAEEAQAIREAAKEIADRKFTVENLKKLGVPIGKYKLITMIVGG